MKEKLQEEIKRCEELLQMYYGIGPSGFFGAGMIKERLKTAELAINMGDEKMMKTCLKELKNIEG